MLLHSERTAGADGIDCVGTRVIEGEQVDM